MARVATGSTAEIKAPNVKLGREGMGKQEGGSEGRKTREGEEEGGEIE